MRINDEQITKLQELYRERFGTELSTQEALTMGTQILGLIEIALRHNARSKDWVQKLLEDITSGGIKK